MPKQVFAVMLDAPSSEVDARIEKQHPNAHRHSDYLTFLAVESDILTQTVATSLGIKPAKSSQSSIASGVVFKLNSAYSGYTNPALWEWLRTARESNQ